MGVVSRTVSLLAERRIARFERACAEPVASQRAVLRRLLRRAADTEWGRRFGFADIHTPAEFRSRVPLTNYESAGPDWHRAFEGARNIAWPGHVRLFALSSGTTAGNKGAAAAVAAIEMVNLFNQLPSGQTAGRQAT